MEKPTVTGSLRVRSRNTSWFIISQQKHGGDLQQTRAVINDNNNHNHTGNHSSWCQKEGRNSVEIIIIGEPRWTKICLCKANSVKCSKCPYQIVILLNSLGQNKPVYIGSDDEIISTIEHIQIIQNIDFSIVFMGNSLFYHRADHEILDSYRDSPSYLFSHSIGDSVQIQESSKFSESFHHADAE